MDKSVPAGAALLLAFIYETETSRKPPECYDVIYGHNQDKLPKRLTSMTVAEVQKAQTSWTKRFKSSAAGAAQFMRTTLKGLISELKLSPSQKFDGNLQDRLGFHLLKRRGYDEFMAGKISRTEFGKRLAMEWASFPVLTATKGAHRQVKRGQSYYVGDALNKSLVAPAKVEEVLERVKAAEGGKRAPVPPVAEVGITDTVTVEVVQRKLYELGYTEVGSRKPDGSFDGKMGKLTRTAILAFKNENDITSINDVIDQAFLAALDTAKLRNLPREDATAETVRKNAPEVRTNWLIKIGALAAGIPAAIGGLLDGVVGNLGFARETIKPLKDMFSDIPSEVWLIAVAVIAGGTYLVARKGEQKGIEAFQSGERR
jgi:muramidase (phage lysozyme)